MNDTEIKLWLTSKRDAMIVSRNDLQNRIDLLNVLISEVDHHTDPRMTIVVPPTKQVAKAKRRGGQRKSGNAAEKTLLALEAAGSNGLTSRELAEVAGLPIGTASSRVSILRKEGKILYDAPRYFVVHSTQEDNNE